MIILGIDPGLIKTGWGIIRQNGSNLTWVVHGTVKPQASLPMAERLAFLSADILKIVDRYDPQLTAIEETFVNKNPETSLKLGMARGAIMSALAGQGLPVAEYTPNQIKKSIVGKGHADKNQVQMMVKVLLPTCEAFSADEADALAVAITHAHFI
jgi:crossover junction endodeoxyribonuclease RuvC